MTPIRCARCHCPRRCLPMRRDRAARVLAVFVATLALGYSIVLVAGPASADGNLPEGWTATKWGPLGPTDRDLLVKVRLAGLWEMPAGDQAQRRGVDPR